MALKDMTIAMAIASLLNIVISSIMNYFAEIFVTPETPKPTAVENFMIETIKEQEEIKNILKEQLEKVSINPELINNFTKLLKESDFKFADEIVERFIPGGNINANEIIKELTHSNQTKLANVLEIFIKQNLNIDLALGSWGTDIFLRDIEQNTFLKDEISTVVGAKNVDRFFDEFVDSYPKADLEDLLEMIGPREAIE